MKKHTSSPGTAVAGNIWLADSASDALAAEQIALLEAIEACGSISAAAKAVGISYKTAWDRLERINNLAPQPLVVRAAGGAGGGGTRLTDYAAQLVAGFHAMQREHQQFLDSMAARIHSFNDLTQFVRGSSMLTSARNQFAGTVTSVLAGAVNSEVAVKINEDIELIVVITRDSEQRLQLQPGVPVWALVKSSSILITTDTQLKTSARNHLVGSISRLTPGAVNSEVVIDLGGSKSIAAIITNGSATDLGLTEGDQVAALFKASSVILVQR